MIQLLKPQLQQIKKRKKGRKAKLKPIKVNRRVELYYTRQLLAISKYCQDQADELVLPAVGENIGDGWFSELFGKLKDRIVKYSVEAAEPLATKVVVDVRVDVDS